MGWCAMSLQIVGTRTDDLRHQCKTTGDETRIARDPATHDAVDAFPPIATEMFFEGKSDALIEQIVKQAPLERIGEPDDIAGVVAFLAGSDGAWVNAQVVRANGGFA